MRRRSTMRVTALLVALLVVGLFPVASVAQSLQEARRERAQIQGRLDEATAQLASIERRAAELEAEMAQLAEEAASLEREIDGLTQDIETRVIDLFKRGSARDPLSVMLASDDADAALDRAQAMRFVVSADVAEAASLSASRVRLSAVQERLAEREAELTEQREAQAAVTRELSRDLERARALEQRLEAEEARRREAERRAAAQRAAARRAAEQRSAQRATTAAATPSSGGKACPVDQPRSFTDTWGAPRSGGRAHRGTDILAPYGTPVRAITSGTWSIQRPGPSAGLWAILRGDDGNQYWYMHLQSHTVASGARVSAGQQTATNGDTGNARGTPHVHFELHPGGGSAINPYPLLRSIC